ncbi:MAG: hypothetical protein KGK05_11965, partial [Xanthomonadaceae bacterium]|nr:hypothetical protein [Xanthomonadaceae bacterium]
MPLWSTSDGRILALVALGGSHGAPVLPQSPQIGTAADWQLIDVTHFVGGGLSLYLGNRVNGWAKFGRGIALTPLNSAAATLGCDSGLTFALNEACPYRPTPVKTGTLSIGAGLSMDRLSVGMDYGVAWLRREPRLPATARAPWDLFATIGNEALPTLAIPALQWADIRDTGIGAQGRWRWSDENSM